MRNLFMAVVLLLAMAHSGLGQEANRMQLQRQVMQRFMQNYRAQGGLTEDQFERFREITLRSFQERNEIQRRERQFWQALEGQMRPGIAADPDSVSGLLDSLETTQRQLLQLRAADNQAFAEFLSPVQRAQLAISLRRLQANIDQIIRRRMQQQPQRGGE